MHRGRLATLAAVVGMLALAPAAAANFHLISIREVAPNPGGLDTAFIELQMYSPGQTQLAGHTISTYAANGTPSGAPFQLTNAPNGENQRSYLIGDDLTAPTPDFLNEQLQLRLSSAGGAVCFDTIDCVSWGSFTGTGLPSPPGAPAAAIPDGSSLTRTIAPGCATLLESSDDTNDSATDFALTTPSPRSNAGAPTEKACSSGGGGGGGDADPPQTKIRKAPKGRIETDRVKVKFKSDEPGSSFECKLDRKPYKPCRSPRKLKNLDDGKHQFRVRATDAAGNTDPSPAKAKFKVVE